MKSLRTCSEGHQYYKSSDCPVCPVCEASKTPKPGLFSTLSAPARRALEHAGITTVEALSTYSEKEILALHGMGPASLPKLQNALEQLGLTFRKPG
ncbi:RNA polymerase alpha subunit C-terminal domain-containing protein [Parapedobacter sp. 2B3]|uniref:RNA polymerase alpha subunit C-terminal domain-containing protein n=1 Tax=Parapedobacter sp. 2B3 TaxID=3342381 RepID=UPI0035B579CD